LSGNSQQEGDIVSSTSFSRAAFQAMRAEAGRLVDVFGFADLYRVSVSVDGVAELGGAHAVSGNYFDVLGVPPAAGRALGTGDDVPGAPPAVVIADALWARRFGRSPSAIGRTIAVNGVPFNVVGATPPGFRGTGQVGEAPELFIPLAQRQQIAHAEDPSDDPNFWWVLMMGRLRDGVTPDAARGTLDVLLKRSVRAARRNSRRRIFRASGRLRLARPVEVRQAVLSPLRIASWSRSLWSRARTSPTCCWRAARRRRELAVRAAIGTSRAASCGS
jgi:hypothetical protein